MLGIRRPYFVTLSLVSCSILASVMACETSTQTTSLATLTGVVVRAETLTNGRGCGRGPSQVLKYAAIAYGQDDATGELTVPVAANVYDCFTDVTFASLPPSPRGNTDFRLSIFMYDASTYEAFKGAIDDARATSTEAATAVETSLVAAVPTWSTTCHATQLQGVQVLAACDPIEVGLAAPDRDAGTNVEADGGPAQTATVELETNTFVTALGTTLQCATAPLQDGGGAEPDASTGDAAPEPDAAGPDAGADAGSRDAGAPAATFDTVRVRWRTDVEVGPIVDVACPTPFVLSKAVSASTHVIFDVGLIASGTPLGQTSCTATATSGTNTSAACTPLP